MFDWLSLITAALLPVAFNSLIHLQSPEGKAVPWLDVLRIKWSELAETAFWWIFLKVSVFSAFQTSWCSFEKSLCQTLAVFWSCSSRVSFSRCLRVKAGWFTLLWLQVYMCRARPSDAKLVHFLLKRLVLKMLFRYIERERLFPLGKGNRASSSHLAHNMPGHRSKSHTDTFSCSALVCTNTHTQIPVMLRVLSLWPCLSKPVNTIF